MPESPDSGSTGDFVHPIRSALSAGIENFISDQIEQVFRRATHSRSLSHHPDWALQQAGVFGHQGDEFCIRLITGETRLVGISLPKHIAGAHTKLVEDIADLILRKRVRCVLTVGV
jgi:hypothetical protein